jgi:16S rRNA (guanine966-N2)-methyltransferase
VRELRARLTEFGAKGGVVEHGDAMRFLASRAPASRSTENAGGATSVLLFDIVFLDPPFDSDLLTTTAALLEKNQWLASGSLIYAECSAKSGLPPLPPNWTATKAKQAGEVGYHLLTRA